MKIAITTPSGHVGGAVADCLLDVGDSELKLLARRRHTLKRFIERGATTAIGSLDDADYLTAATEDVEALFWVTPPGYGSDNVRAFQNRLGKAAAKAIRANQIPRVVNLSSLGADLAAGAGPISGLHDVESILDDATDAIIHLRPGFFFENLLWQLDSIRGSGLISLPISGSRKFPMIGARDIGNAAAQWLVDPVWTGHDILELHGPEDLSFDDVAEILTEALGRKIIYVRCDDQKAHQAMVAGGLSDNSADLMMEMYQTIEDGTIHPLQPRSPETTTPTSLAEFAREVMLPLVEEPLAH